MRKPTIDRLGGDELVQIDVRRLHHNRWRKEAAITREKLVDRSELVHGEGHRGHHPRHLPHAVAEADAEVAVRREDVDAELLLESHLLRVVVVEALVEELEGRGESASWRRVQRTTSQLESC